MTDQYKYIIEAARAGGAVVKKYFGQELNIQVKSTAYDVRTQADTESEQAILAILNTHFPGYNIIAEENGLDHRSSEYTFIIDPLDGTHNFTLGIPVFCTSIALQKNNEVIFGVIYNPILDRCYYAEKGMGAWLNGEKITVSKSDTLNQSTVSYACGYQTSRAHEAVVTAGLINKDVKRLALFWCPTADLVSIAEGKSEAVIIDNCEVYDFAAGRLIIREAGGVLLGFDGNVDANDSNRHFVAANTMAVGRELASFMSTL